jgi:sugar lactone lactonase YvrE
VEWKCGATSGQVVAGGNGKGNRNDQLSGPTDVVVDEQTDCLIICDRENRRIMRWPRRGGTSGQPIISNVYSYGLTMDDDGFLYVCDWEKHEVKRWKIGETEGILVAGGKGKGERLDQLNCPLSIFVDRDHSVYVSDCENHRVIKWVKDAKEGIVVAGGGEGLEYALTQVSYPRGVIVDQLGTVYVADYSNHRIMRWSKGATQGSVVVGGNRRGGQANQLHSPVGLSFDRHGNLYVADNGNHRIQKFLLEDR